MLGSHREFEGHKQHGLDDVESADAALVVLLALLVTGGRSSASSSEVVGSSSSITFLRMRMDVPSALGARDGVVLERIRLVSSEVDCGEPLVSGVDSPGEVPSSPLSLKLVGLRACVAQQPELWRVSVGI